MASGCAIRIAKHEFEHVYSFNLHDYDKRRNLLP
jgi:hypothetical protein